MENNLLIVVIGMFFLGMAVYLRFKRRIPFFNAENRNIDVIGTLSNIAIILTLIYGIYSYTHTIYPVFEKEQSLSTTQRKVEELNKLLDNERIYRENAESKLETKIQMYEDISNRYTILQDEKYNLQDKFNDLEMKAKAYEKEAVFNLVLREVYKIVDMDIYLKNINLQDEALKCANKNLEVSSESTIKYKAYSILKKYAEDKLNSKSTYSDALDIYTYFYEVYYKF